MTITMAVASVTQIIADEQATGETRQRFKWLFVGFDHVFFTAVLHLSQSRTVARSPSHERIT